MATTSDKGIAILGAGIFAKEAHLPALQALGSDAPPLLAVYSRSEKSSRECSDAAVELGLAPAPAIYHDGDPQANLDTLLARPDITAVIVVLPITLQPEIVLKALAAGKHVLSEKPVAPDVARGIALIKTYNAEYRPKNLVWRVAENFEAEPGFRAARAAIAEGKIGKVNMFKATMNVHIELDNKYYKTPWRTVPDYQGGFLLDGGVHTIAVLRTVLPHPLTHLSGFASLNFEHLKPHDTIHAVARGATFHGIVELCFGTPTKTTPPADQFLIIGSEGWMSINSKRVEGKGNVLRVLIKRAVKVEGKPAEEVEEIIDSPSAKGVEAEFASFFDKIRGKQTLDIGDPLGALHDVAFIQAGLNSGGELVDLAKLVSEG